MLNCTAFAPEVGIQGAILDNKMSGQLTMLLLQPLKPLPLGQLPSLPSIKPSSCMLLQFLSNMQENVMSVWLRRQEPRSPSCWSTRVAPWSFCEAARSCQANQLGPKWPGSNLQETGHACTGPQGAIWCGTGNSAMVSLLINGTIQNSEDGLTVYEFPGTLPSFSVSKLSPMLWQLGTPVC